MSNTANTAKNAILRAKIEGVIHEIMVKTTADNVFIDAESTLTSVLTNIFTMLNNKTESSDIESAINELKQELLGDTPIEAYNTFTELAQYIETHQEAADALTEAIGKKADQTTVDGIVETLNSLGALATKSTVGENDLDATLKEKVNAAAEGNHSHTNKTVLDGITAEKVSAWDAAEANAKSHANDLNTGMNTRVEALEAIDHEHENKDLLDSYTQTEENLADAVAKKHEHANMDVLNQVTAEAMAAMMAKANVFYSATEPENFSENDLWVQLVD